MKSLDEKEKAIDTRQCTTVVEVNVKYHGTQKSRSHLFLQKGKKWKAEGSLAHKRNYRMLKDVDPLVGDDKTKTDRG